MMTNETTRPYGDLQAEAGDDIHVWTRAQTEVVPEGHIAVVVRDANGEVATAILAPVEAGFLGYVLRAAAGSV